MSKGNNYNPQENFIETNKSNYQINDYNHHNLTNNQFEFTQHTNINDIPNKSHYNFYSNSVNDQPKYNIPHQLDNSISYSNNIEMQNKSTTSNLSNKFIQGNPTISFNQIPQHIILQSNIIIIDSYQKFKVDPTLTTCSTCKLNVITQVEKEINLKNLVFYLLTGPIIYMLFQKIRDKDISLMNAKHICSRCKKEIYQYEAC